MSQNQSFADKSSYEINDALFEMNASFYADTETLKTMYKNPTAIVEQLLLKGAAEEVDLINFAIILDGPYYINNAYKTLSKEVKEIKNFKSKDVFKPNELFDNCGKLMISIKIDEKDDKNNFQTEGTEAILIGGKTTYYTKDKETGKLIKKFTYKHAIKQVPTPKPKPVQSNALAVTPQLVTEIIKPKDVKENDEKETVEEKPKEAKTIRKRGSNPTNSTE